ncbi:MAG TPA: carboxypeptidase-like regulatory domain-containing protein, partial [Nitrospira sp.]|nr:carboxypeptidase-like regulatory domain-containing protein [Nitrospira sp.]
MPPGFSQTVTTGEVTGTVLDPAGAHVPEATVTLKSADTGESRSVPSNDSGVYRFTFVKPGKYEISALSAGLKSDVGSLAAGVGQVQDLDVHLKIEEPKEVILVTDEAPLLNTDNANIVYTLSSRQLDLLPLPGGDLVSVAYSMPGVVINYRSGSGFGTFVSQGVGGLSNLFTMNGIDDMDPYLNVNNHGPTGLLLGANEVQEASIVQNPYEGQYGRQAGAQVNYVTKSGTNTYHGNLLYNYNGTQMNANDFFSNASGTPRPHAVSNQYAAAIGGPVLKDKLFFFADTEGLRYALPGSASVITIPSPAAQSYSLRTIQPSQVPFYRKMFDLYNSAPGAERAVPVTTGKGLLQDSSGNLGCGALAGTPAGTGGVFGTDVSCAEAWTTNVPNQTSEWLLSTRLDYNLSSNQRLFFRFKTDHGYSADVRNFMNPLFTAFRTQPDYEGQANYSLAITPRLLNNFIGAATYNDYVSSVADLNAALAIFPVQLVIRPGLANGGIPINSSIGPPATYPTGRRETQIQMIDDVSYLAGRHSVKAGVNYRYIRETDLGSGFINRGQFSLSLNALVSGALSPSSSYTQSFTASPILHLRLHSVGFYVQDQWSITPRLKVTATLRFDRNGNPDCVDSCFARLV